MLTAQHATMQQGPPLHASQAAPKVVCKSCNPPWQVVSVEQLTEVGDSHDFGRLRGRRQLAQRTRQQAHAVRRESPLAKLVDDTQRPAAPPWIVLN